jgi:hypothetical protein
MFSGGQPDSNEHVIPKWLQRRFKLWDQVFVLPNGTRSRYRHVTVPVREEDNGRFAEIESAMSKGTFTPSEAYLWALKIHIGLIFRDSRLKATRHQHDSPPLLDAAAFATEIFLFRQVYDTWKEGGHTNPSPFGTVFVIDRSVDANEFDFFHCMTTGVMGIAIDHRFIVVFLWDQGDGRESNIWRQWTEHHVHTIANASDENRMDVAFVTRHVWACESAYWLWRHRRSFKFVKAGSSLALIPPLSRPPPKPLDEATYRRICCSFALELKTFDGEVNNTYAYAPL